MNPENYRVGQLLDFMERIADHTPDPGECDCNSCGVWNSVCGLSNLMAEQGVAQ